MPQTHKSVRDMLIDFFGRNKHNEDYCFQIEINGQKRTFSAADMHQELQNPNSEIAIKLLESAAYFDNMVEMGRQMQESARKNP